jgi:hypothetical protein
MEITREEKLRIIQDRIGYYNIGTGLFEVDRRGLSEILLDLLTKKETNEIPQTRK